MSRPRRAVLGTWAALFTITVSACGGGDGESGEAGLARVSTLAYVVHECRASAQGGGTIRQRLEILRRDQAPITVADTSAAPLPGAAGFCQVAGASRRAVRFLAWGVFRRLGVSPDGSRVVFEVNDVDPLSIFPSSSLSSERKGIFAVAADGTSLRRLGPASREPSVGASTAPSPTFAFSPDGRTIAYVDRGPSRNDEDAVQIVTLDLDTGTRRQVTQLPPAEPRSSARTCCPFFDDERTISFLTIADVDGKNPEGDNVTATVDIASGTTTVADAPVAIPGSSVLASFRISGSEVGAALLRVPGMPVNPGGLGAIQEMFVIDGSNVLQLTNFRRQDTWGGVSSADGQRVFFSASANPLGINPTESCQIFSIDRNAGDLRQLTDFSEGPSSPTGCHSGAPPLGCTVFNIGRDAPSDTLVFYSTCDLLGTNPYGSQIFAMLPDGTGLHQLTRATGYAREANGGVTLEVPFLFAHPGRRDAG